MSRMITRLISLFMVIFVLLLSACGNKNNTSSDSDTTTSTTEDDGIIDDVDDLFDDDNSTGTETNSGTTGSAASPTGGGTTKTPVKTDKTPNTSKTINTDELGKGLPDIKITNKKLTILSAGGFDIKKYPLLESKYGVTFDSIAVGSENLITAFVTRHNSDSPVDVLWGDFNPALIARGFVQNWDKYINLNDPMWKDVKGSNDSWKVGGKYYYLITSGGKQNVVWYNRKLMKGAEDPASLVKKGQWTWDKLSEYTKKFTIESGSNVIQYGLCIETPSSFLYATGSDWVKFENGVPKNMVKSEGAARAMDFFTKMYKNNKIYDGNDPHNDFIKGKIAMLASEKWLGAAKFADMIERGDVMWVPTPKESATSKYYVAEETPGFYLDSKARNVPAAQAFMTVIRYSATDPATVKALREKALANKGSGVTQETLDMEEWNRTNTIGVQLCWTYFGLGQYFGEVYTRTLKGESWSTVAEWFSPKVDQAINTFKTNTKVS